MTKTFPICPICSGYIPNATHPGQYPGAISRRDNKTEICSACGIVEALEVLKNFIKAKSQPNDHA